MPFLMIAKGLLGGAAGLVRRVGAWFGRLQPFQALSLALGLLSAFLWFQLGAARSDVREWRGKFVEEKAVFKQTVQNFRDGSAEATKQMKATIARVAKKQATINKESTDAYQANLADIRARYERMRHGAASNQRPANGDRASPVPDSAPGPDGEALSRDQPDLGYTAEVELQLNALISWVQRQTSVNPNL